MRPRAPPSSCILVRSGSITSTSSCLTGRAASTPLPCSPVAGVALSSPLAGPPWCTTDAKGGFYKHMFDVCIQILIFKLGLQIKFLLSFISLGTLNLHAKSSQRRVSSRRSWGRWTESTFLVARTFPWWQLGRNCSTSTSCRHIWLRRDGTWTACSFHPVFMFASHFLFASRVWPKNLLMTSKKV